MASAFAFGKRETKTVEVGETFTVYSSGHTRLQSVLWTWDTYSFELVGSLTGYSTSATFKAKRATTPSGAIIQATVYYYASQGTIATGKFFDDWTIHVEDRSTVSLNTSSKALSPGGSFMLTASVSSSSYTGSYKWSTSNSSVAYVSGSGSDVTVKAVSSGRTTIRVTLDNGKYAECTVVVEDHSTVSMDYTSKNVSTGDSFYLTAQASSGYSGSYSWSSSNSSVASCSGSSQTVSVKARSAGYSTIKVTLSNGASAQCEVHVKDVDVKSVTVPNVTVLAEKETTASMSVNPSNATVKTTTWGISKGEDIVSISSLGNVTGKKPGTATIYCTVNGNVRSNDATVTVTEPKLIQVSSAPENSAIDISVFVTPSVTYSHDVFEGNGLSSVSLRCGNTNVSGTVEISGCKLKFIPARPLNPLVQYTLFIPRNAVKNKWGSASQSDVSLLFTTAKLEKATLTMTPASGNHLISTDRITMKATPSDAKIYYTTNGESPDTKSLLYTEPLKLDGDVTIKAIAVREGYESSDIITAEYYKSQSEIMAYNPNNTSPLFNYAAICPHIKFSGKMERSNNFRRISLTTDSGEKVSGEALLTYNILTFVPDEPLRNSTTYTVDIPRDAIKAENGEVFRGFNWSFTTPTLPIMVGMQGDESVFVLSENGLLQTRGMCLETYTSADGSYTYKDNQKLVEKLTDAEDIACGYTHRLVKKGTNVSGYGMTFCGETGTSASISAIGNIKVIKAGFQTSAIIGEDNTLWMCGRNDFYQLGDSTGTTTKAFVKVADEVIDVALGNGYTLYVDSSNRLWAVGRNHKGQLGDGTTNDSKTPVKIMENVAKVYASTSGFFSACVTNDNKLYTWGDNSSGQLGREAGRYSATPSFVMNDVDSVSLGERHILALANKYKLYAWGDNSYGQIGHTNGNITKPTLIKEGVRFISAGPHTSLVLANSGKITGYGKRIHSNFGNEAGNANDYVVCDGYSCNILQGVTIEPITFEAEPESRFALTSMPQPFTADYEDVEWTSANPEIATVEGNGIIHTQNLGESMITVRFIDRYGTAKEATSKIVCTDNPLNTGIKSVSNDTSWYVYTEANSIIIKNTNIGATYTIYNLQGHTIGQSKAQATNMTFKIHMPGVYLVHSGNKVVKVVCQ